MKKSFGKKPSSGRSSGASKPAFGRGAKAKTSRYPGKTSRDDDRPKRSFDEEKPRRSFDNDRPKRRTDGESPRKSFGDERPRKRYDDDRPKRSFDGEKPRRSFDSDRPKRRTDGESPRKPFGDDRPRKRYDDDRPKRSFDGEKPRRSFDSDRPKRRTDGESPRKPFGDERPRKRYDDDRPKRSFDGEKPRRSFDSDRPKRRTDGESPRKPFGDERPRKRYDDDRPKRSFDGEKPRRSFDNDRPKRRIDGDAPRKSYGDDRPRKRFDDDRPKRRADGDAPRKSFNDERPRRRFNDERPQKQVDDTSRGDNWQVFENAEEAASFKESTGRRSFRKPKGAPSQYAEAANGQIRLNRFIANTGLCSRREADELIEAGVIKVNGKIVTELGTKIGPSDTVHYGDQLLRRERLQYVLLNKPKDFITTTDDPQDRKTVLQLVEDACKERIYPVGRLDRNTTGLLLLTNDGDIADRLMHPRFGVRKIYHVTLDKALRQEDFEAIENGIELEDGPIKADELSYVGEGGNRREVGIVLHSGRNRIVRRIFEQLGYVVAGLDRVVYAGLTKKNLPRGRWRHLSEEEIGMLKMTLGGSAKQSKPKAAGYRKKKEEG